MSARVLSPSKFTAVSEVQPAKAYALTEVTDEGILSVTIPPLP